MRLGQVSRVKNTRQQPPANICRILFRCCSRGQDLVTAQKEIAELKAALAEKVRGAAHAWHT